MSEVSEEADQIIRVMPETLANKIAAGEVVQRPASAAKELIENALDAGADEVAVVVKGAGSELVQVIDDGCGMGRADAVSCFRRHATSKIESIEDLERIRTLGFRGEALASIAAVSRVELRTKRIGDAAGTLVRVEGGETVGVEPCATQDGTSIAVRSLFYNVPARRNFLKTDATEFKHLVETFQYLALSNPGIAFTLHHDGNEVYRLRGAGMGDFYGDLTHRIGELFGREQAEHLIPVTERTSYLTVHGFVGEPDRHRRSRGEQFLFINGRFVKDRSIDHAVMSAYEELIPERSYPFYTLFLEIDPRHVDVNVHPTKAEVKFDDERGIYAFVKTVVKKALGTAYLMPQVEPRERPAPSGEPEEAPTFRTPAGGARPADFTAGGTAAPRPAPEGAPGAAAPRSTGGGAGRWDAPGELTDRLYAPAGPAPGPAPEEEPVDVAGEREPDDDGLLWQLHDRFILTQIRSGLMILDQNAAHERILYERALQTMRGGAGLSQQLLFPHTVDFNPADYELLGELMPDLRALGFDLELFSGRSVVVRGVPVDLRGGDARSVLDDVLEQYKTYRERLQVRGRDNLAKSIARRSAIRAGTRLSTAEMRSLIDQLFQCEMPYACPHGRPTIVKIPIEELEKRFGRNT